MSSNPAIIINAEQFPVEHPVDAAFRVLRDAAILRAAEQQRLENRRLHMELMALARDALVLGTDPALVNKGRAILARDAAR